MNGAERLVRTLLDEGVDVCFANPGTSEMHLVTALDHEPRIHSVLCLFEGVATGAADGHARVRGHVLYAICGTSVRDGKALQGWV
jgi:acetolactate synthase-1/2/3 large subunit